MNAEKQYLEILRDLVNSDVKQENRTGVDTYKIPPRMIQHDMSEGFPLLTTKRVAWKTMKVELEGFIKGITSKKWFQNRGCHIWDQWANPKRVPYSNDEDSKAKMVAEDDLGLIYGSQWRNFHDPKNIGWDILNDKKVEGGRVDQLENIIDTLHENPTDRRMICLAWNPLALDYQALPACHVLFRVGVSNGKLDLTWYQRSVDTFLGLSFNLASYALLLHLIAKESGFKEGILTGFLDDLHLYENHIDQAKEQLSRKPKKLPTIETENFKSIFDWGHDDTVLIDYDYHPAIKAPVAMNIQKQEKYYVGSHQFSSLEEAEKFAAREQKQKDLIVENTRRLDACDLTYIPVEIGEDLDIFYRGGECHYPYESVFSSNGVRYCEDEIIVITQRQWLEKFVAEKMNHIIDVNDFSIVLRALVQFNLDNHVDSYKLLEAISHFQFSPEYVHDYN